MNQLSDPDSKFVGFLKEASNRGWKITYVTREGIQLARRPPFPWGLFILGLLLLIFVVGIFFILAAFFIYFCSRDEVVFLTISEIHESSPTALFNELNPDEVWSYRGKGK